MRYFDHDTQATSDDKIIALRMECGPEAVYCYWGILEKIYADEAPLDLSEDNPEAKALSYRLAVAYQSLIGYVENMLSTGLLVVVENSENGGLVVTSERAEANIRAYREKRESARQAGKKGGAASKRQANAKRSLSGRLADAKLRKEKKVVDTYTVSTTTSCAVGAPEGGGAPAPECPVCGVPMDATSTFKPNTDQRLYRCPLCHEEAYA